MELYQLEYFLEAARQRNFTRAAAHLHLAQAALSERIRKLEDELGTPLFNRGRRETVLTPAGETMRLHAEALLRPAVEDLIGLRGGRLTIAAIPSVNACLLLAAMADSCEHRQPAVADSHLTVPPFPWCNAAWEVSRDGMAGFSRDQTGREHGLPRSGL